MPDEQKFLVFSNPIEGRDDEYNEWYDNVHLGDVCRVPGVLGAKRYDLVPTDPAGAAPAHAYLAVYDLSANASVSDVLAELGQRFGGPEMASSEAFDLTTVSMAVWRPRS
jgi:hypothetical protein